MTHSEFKEAARRLQIEFKEKELGVKGFPYRKIKGKEDPIPVKSSLQNTREDMCDANGNYRIFFSGISREITEYLDRKKPQFSDQMLTNLLRSVHIPYNIFFPMLHDKEGAAKIFNKILGSDRIAEVTDIRIEYNPAEPKPNPEKPSERIYQPGGLKDGTAFDVYVEYIPINAGQNDRGVIGIEVKYTEKEYPLVKFANKEKTEVTKEWRETHDENGIHIADNYRIPTENSGWFKPECFKDVPFEDIKRGLSHVVKNRYRQIWRNHILGAAMLQEGLITEFTSLTLYPKENGHFHGDKGALQDYKKSMLTESGANTFKSVTYEEMFEYMKESLNPDVFPYLDEWISYLHRRYLVQFEAHK